MRLVVRPVRSGSPNLSAMTVAQIRQWAKSQNIKAPSGLRKDTLIRYLHGFINDRQQGVNPGQAVTFPLNILEYRVADPQMPWIQHLHTHGWATVPLPGWKPEFVERFLSWFTSCCPSFNRADPETWTAKNLPPMSRGIMKHYYGHTALQWEIRELCAPFFAEIWGCSVEDLLTAFDGGCFLPAKPTTTFSAWVHNDCPRDYTTFSCVQGIVNFVENGPEDGGLVLVEGSHQLFAEYMARHQSEGFMWGLSDQTDPLLSERNLIKICAPAGHLLLFDSRMFHCNAPAYGSVYRSDGTPRFRLCHYVSFQPRSGATAAELQKRQHLYEKGRMTGHWCYGPYFKETSEHPRYPHAFPAPAIEIAQLNPLQRRFVGY